MESHLTHEFRKCLIRLPQEARENARAAYQDFKRDPFSSGLRFKEIYRDGTKSFWSARTSLGYRVVGARVDDDTVVWFWIGSHAEYDGLFKRFKRMSAL